MRAIPNGVYYDRMDAHVRRGRRQVIGWLAFSLLVIGLMGLGVGTVASRGSDPFAAGGGRVQPQTVPARAVFKTAIWRFTGHYTRGLLQNCMGVRCAVFTRDGGTQVTFVKVGGTWRMRTILVPDITATR